ncbi:mitotic checkpoint regulator, MAD2B-interacting-domain-containing protein [Nemania sp. FL0916]|nr:mitotic checkpoint regulator, MAD2B-interacting-domain-containing protein [Nemania sp. FL0916]
MGLVDYSSDSDSEAEAPTKSVSQQTKQPAPSGNKKPFQKVVDRSKPGKIVVSLPTNSSSREDSSTATNGDEPPAKRARTSKGGAFSGFNSFLPPPKNVGKKPATHASSSASNVDGDTTARAPRPGVHLKTGAAPGFSRNTDHNVDGTIDGDEEATPAGGMGLPAPKFQQPTIPAGQKPADEVELVGKPLMFRPLSVARKKPTKKATVKSVPTTSTSSGSTAAGASAPASTVSTTQTAPANTAQPPKKKVSLFSISDESPQAAEPRDEGDDAYEPLMDTDDAFGTSTADAFAAYDAEYGSSMTPSQPATVSSAMATSSNTIDSIVGDMNLSAAARRELFGRHGVPSADTAAAKVINFDTEKEYAHNEVVRATGEQQTHNPLRAIAPGKHSLRQLVSQVHNQRDALEESFAKGRAKQNEAGSRYGWR